MDLNVQEIKDILTQKAVDALQEFQLKKVVRKGKVKKVKKAKNAAQAQKLSGGRSAQKRKMSSKKTQRSKKKKAE